MAADTLTAEERENWRELAWAFYQAGTSHSRGHEVRKLAAATLALLDALEEAKPEARQHPMTEGKWERRTKELWEEHEEVLAERDSFAKRVEEEAKLHRIASDHAQICYDSNTKLRERLAAAEAKVRELTAERNRAMDHYCSEATGNEGEPCELSSRKAEARAERYREELGSLLTGIRLSLEDHCSCGGGGPDDPHTCNVCKVYHDTKEWRDHARAALEARDE